MAELTIEGLILSVGYFAIFVCMFVNGMSGLPSSPFVYVTAGLLIVSGKIDWIPTVLLGTLGNVLGNIILYEATRQMGLQWLLKEGGYFRRYTTTISRIQKAFELKGTKIVIIGKFVPMVKVVVPVVAGVAKMNRFVFIVAIGVTSLVWAIASVGYGYYFGEMAKSGDMTWLAGITLLFIPVVMWWFLRHIRTLSVED
jgi:membrane protein DedA with SNARE-associated domain